MGVVIAGPSASPPRVVPLDLAEPPAALAARLRRLPGFAFLDSATTPATGATHPDERFSLLAWSAPAALRVHHGRAWRRDGRRWRRLPGDPLPHLAAALAPRAARGPLPAPGALGYLAYDLFPLLDAFAPPRPRPADGLPDLLLELHHAHLVYDHRAGTWSAVLLPDAPPDALDALMGPLAALPAPPPARARVGPARADHGPDLHRAAVRAALEHIAAGDVYQVNLARRFTAAWRGDPWALHARLRARHPARFAAYLAAGDHAVVSASPELFLRVEGDRVETRPIKGTRPRGATPAADAAAVAELQASPKETAELSMIVDLERNDLGRVCAFGSVEVAAHRVVEALPTLFHTHSEVRGRLRPEVDAVALLRATFPGGSISGCPKSRAVEVIDALEPCRRHLYTGAVGLLGADGDARLSIAIRTVVIGGGSARFHVGGGIVADSDPEAELAETDHKARALHEALTAVGRGEG